MDPEFARPTAAEMRRLQDEAINSNPSSTGPMKAKIENLELSADGLYRTSDRLIWVPPMAEDLQLRICIMAQTCLFMWDSNSHRRDSTPKYRKRLYKTVDGTGENLVVTVGSTVWG
jgi:hypothetical protein